MDKTKKILSDIVGKKGYEVLQKAVFKRGTQAVIDPLEFYFPLIVAPRSILSWLVQNVKPLKVHEHKELPFPGREDIKIYVEKQDIDQYRAEFRQGGKIIHSFEKQSLPAASAHLMTVGEMYESFGDSNNKPDLKTDSLKQEDKEENNSKEVVRSIMSMNDLTAHQEDPEKLKWIVSHANVKELTGVIGKLVDALVAKKVSEEKEGLDKMAIKEHKGDEQKVKESISPEEKDKKDRKAAKRPANVLKDYEEETKVHKEIAEETLKDKDTFTPPKIQEIKSGKEAAEAKIKKEELLSKPYASKAQRRYFHAAAARGEIPKKTVKEWDKESKGKDLPEKVSKQDMAQASSPGPGSSNEGSPPIKTEMKETAKPLGLSVLRKLLKPQTTKSEEKIEKQQMGAEAPAGAGMPKKQQQPKPPTPPTPASNQPKAAQAKTAQKQAQTSAEGKPLLPPAPPGARGPKMTPTSAKPNKAVSAFTKPQPLANSEKSYILSESEIYTPCPDCGKSEFIKSEDGSPKFNPCACFSVMKKDELGKPFKFVTVLKKNDGSFTMNFSPEADSEAVKAFLLTLKASLLVKRKFGDFN